MKGHWRLIGLVLLLAVLNACAAPVAAPAATPVRTVSPPEAIALAEEFFSTLVVERDFAGATENFDSVMLSALPAAKLEEMWETLVAQVGAYQERPGEPSVEHVDQYERVTIPLKFEKASLDMQVVVDSTTGLISGLFFVPSQNASLPYAAPDYVDPDSFEEQEVTIGGGEWTLPGTLTIPKGEGPFPAVVLVHGSGPNDRDETIGPNKPFKDLAWGLASRGIAVLRYEKRTKVYADRLVSLDGKFTVKEETIDDTLAAVSLLRERQAIDPGRIVVLGHSLGGMLPPRIAQAGPGIAGLIVMAGPTRPLEDLVLEQAQYIVSQSGNPSLQEQHQIQALEQQVQAIKALQPSGDGSGKEMVLGAPASYWLDLRGYDPAEAAGALSLPMLILQGERDYQVTMADFRRWQDVLSSEPRVQFKSYPELNHLFIAGSGPSTPKEYQTPGHVAAYVIDDLASWIAQLP
jgi:hypothetical protein